MATDAADSERHNETCRHCGQPVPSALRDSGFCCAGCAYVFELIHSEDLDRFYDLASRTSRPPVGDAVFQPQAGEWARRHQEIVEARAKESTDSESESDDKPSAAVVETTLEIGNLSCAACLWLVESRFEAQPGAVRIAIDPSDGTTRLSWSSGIFDLVEFVADCARFGYEIRLPQARSGDGEGSGGRLGNRALGVRLGASSAFALNTMAFTLPRYFGMDPDFLFASLFTLVAASSATLAAIAALSWFGPRAVQSLRSGVPHIDLPIVLGIVAAWLGSLVGWVLQHEALLYFDFVAIFSTLMLAGRWVQERAMAATRSQLRGPGLPRYVSLLDSAESESDGGDSTLTVPVEDLQQAMCFRLPPGEVAPVNTLLIGDNGGVVSREWISGEADPQAVEPGAVVAAGVRNASVAELHLRALESFTGSELAGLEKSADPSRNDGNRFGGRLLQFYLWSVIGLSGAGGLYWWLVRGDVLAGLQVAISVLVVSCPCALGVAIPLADRLAARRAENSGAIVRTPKLWGRLNRVRRLVFDKTGTLTLQFPQLCNPQALQALTDTQKGHLWQLVARNRHPFALALRAALMQGFAAPDEVADCEEIPGKGVRLTDSTGQSWSLGSARWLAASESDADSASDCVLACDTTILARFTFREHLRERARDEIAWLNREIGPVSVLSGDRGDRVQALAKRLDLPAEQAFGGHSPQAKADWLDAHGAEQTLFLGDGANDRHAFDRSMARGAPLSAFAPLEERIDFVLLGGSLSPLRRLFRLAGRHRRTLWLILAAGITYNAVAVVVCLNQLMHPLLAAVAMPLSSLIILALTWWRLGPSAKATREERDDEAAASLDDETENPPAEITPSRRESFDAAPTG